MKAGPAPPLRIDNILVNTAGSVSTLLKPFNSEFDLRKLCRVFFCVVVPNLWPARGLKLKSGEFRLF